MFDPNKKTEQVFATFAPGRSPRFKVHHLRRHAIAALKNQAWRDVGEWFPGKGYDYEIFTIPDEVMLYERENNKWVEVEFKRVYHKSDEIL